MSYRLVIGVSLLALASGGLGGCDKAPKATDVAPAPASPPSPALDVQTSEQAQAEVYAEAAQVEADAKADARAASDPVYAVIRRADLCLHFAGEEGYDAERRAQIDKAFDDNRCDTVVADGDALKRAHPADAARIDAALADLRP